MKHSEKEHLKENQVATALLAANQNRTQLLTIGAGVLVLLTAIGGFVTWQRNQQAAVAGLLAEAMVSYESPVQTPTPGSPQAAGTFPTEKAKLDAALPKFLAAYEAGPSSTPGRLARSNAAAVLVGLGRYDEARAHYEELATGSDLIAHGAALGKAHALARAGQYGPAVDTLKTLVAQTTNQLPVDGVLMELARTYRASGQIDEARKTLTEIVEKHADSPFAAEARSEIDKLKA